MTTNCTVVGALLLSPGCAPKQDTPTGVPGLVTQGPGGPGPGASPTPPPPPPGPGGSAPTAILNYSQPGSFTVKAATREFVQFKIPTTKGTQFRQVQVEFDFYHNGWCSYQGHDQHGLMQFDRDGWRGNVIAWIPINHQRGKTVTIRNNIDDPNKGPGTFKPAQSYRNDQIVSGAWHHVKFIFDSTKHIVDLTITPQGGQAFHMQGLADSYSGSTMAAVGPFFKLTLGSLDGGENGPECSTDGWIFSAINVRGY